MTLNNPSGKASDGWNGGLIDLIDDDEWMELGMSLYGAVSRLPRGSRLVEAVQVPPFRLAISATGTDLPNVVTRPYLPGLTSPDAVVRAAIELAEAEYRFIPPSQSQAVAVAVTQSADGELFAVAVVGLPGESRSFITFELPPGGHSIDVGERTIDLLEGWAIRREIQPSAA